MLKATRRDWMSMTAGGLLGASMSRWMPLLAADTAAAAERKRSCILLWMPGGPSQMDTFDLKPEHKNGGEFSEIETSVPGIRISEHLPQLAKQMDECAIVRSMSTKEGDHGRATYLMRTGYLPQGPLRHPTLGSLFSKELAQTEADLPNFISVAPYRFLSPAAFGPGYLGPQFAPLVVGSAQPGQNDDDENSLQVENLKLSDAVNTAQAGARLQLLEEIENGFRAQRPGVAVNSHKAAYDQAVRMMQAGGAAAFDLSEESDETRDQYGRNRFGQGCLLARRLVERGVPFVEVSLSSAAGNAALGWDSHQNNFETVKSLSEVLDAAWATLMSDLKQRGLLDSTLIVWMGEFGRTPVINANAGRDHFPAAWSTVLAGGGIKGGQVYGKTGEDGMQVAEKPVTTPDLLATICAALGIDPQKQNMSNVGRPVRIVDPEAKPIQEVLA
ncbi:hypothetical protein Pan258_41630 [Symmachiella dynata]|uniref:DUF1501 domain-containing protein n=1 Tax=Symmachiella dynata TaxID=2527995 RepID=UPI00118A4173|nr:DUF1501 domain-containing protein [Symmachiella dynata]QDT50107.1 hypothetical protein Pan258_41630 [Symmachiella dynata]